MTDQAYLEPWKKIAAECIRRIRVYAPETYILYGSYHNNGVEEVQYLDAPYDDKVVYNFHCYEPVKFTHQGAYWTSMINFASAIEKAAKYGAELYCGEYGVIDIASPEDTVKWYKSINRVFEKYCIIHCAWTYKEMDFGLADERLEAVRDELLKYM